MKAAKKKALVARAVAKIAKEAGDVAVKISGYAEAPFKEFKSSKLVAEFLRGHGFRVGFDFRNIPTAFRAEFGSGKPCVGMLGEYDALPNCGPKDGEWGHGCGHNLLGVGSAAGAVAAATAAAAAGIGGKIVYYGCPAEEALAGKAYMARDGAFRDLDACISWHPGGGTAPVYYGGAALDSVVFEFFGKTCHAASPVGGKSALDAAILFDIAVNYLRETVPENVRLHSVIVNGGDAPNVVPAYAKSWYYIRAKNREQVDEIRKLVEDCARGAAIATQTRYRSTRITAIYDMLPNDALYETVKANLKLFGTTPVTPADKKNARKLGLAGEFYTKLSFGDKGAPGRASTDDDTVSWLTPLARFRMATHAKGTTSHHRVQAAQMSLPFALRGMLQASKVFAGVALDFLANASLRKKVGSEFRKGVRGFKFDALIPKKQKIPADVREIVSLPPDK